MNKIVCGDCIEVMKGMEENSVEAVVCDPPYGLGFMGKAWDKFGMEARTRIQKNSILPAGGQAAVKWEPSNFQEWCQTWAVEALRVAKPGAYLLAFGGTRTFHRLTCAIEDAGWVIRDTIFNASAAPFLLWVTGQGFPKSKNIGCKCGEDTLRYNHNDVSQKGVRDLQGDVDTQESLSGQAEHNVRAEVCGASDINSSNGEKKAARKKKGIDDSVRGMRKEVHPLSLLDKERQDAVLQREMQRNSAGSGMGQTRTQRASSLGQGGGGIIPKENERTEQSSVEGRDNLQAEQRELHRAEVRPVPEGVSADGAEGQLHNGASACDGAASGAATGEKRSSAPQEPRHAGQSNKKPGAVPEQSGAQGGRGEVCETCGGLVNWRGYGSGLKPAVEPIILAQAPLDGTYAQNILKHGCGVLNIDACRIGATDKQLAEKYASIRNAGTRDNSVYGKDNRARSEGRLEPHSKGRWPANFLLSHSLFCEKVGEREGKGYAINRFTDGAKPFGGGAGHPYESEERGKQMEEIWECVPDCPVAILDGQSGVLKSGRLGPGHSDKGKKASILGSFSGRKIDREFGNDQGGASRFFYCAKASRSERNAGLEEFKEKTKIFNGQAEQSSKDVKPVEKRFTTKMQNNHPTVKPLAILRYLCRLVTPPGGTVLDCFAGSGSTGCAAVLEGFQFVGIEKEAEYVKIMRSRIEHWVREAARAGVA